MNGRLPSLLLAVVLLAGCSGSVSGDDDAEADAADVDAFRPAREDGGLGDVVPEVATFPPACGDGVVDPGEECDDRNRENGDECDWLCRAGPGSFDFPPPDDTVAPVILSGETGVVVPRAEELVGEWAVAWMPGSYGVAYQVLGPTYAVRFRVVDRAGTAVVGPTTVDEVAASRVSALTGDEGGFRLFRSTERAGFLTSVAPSGTAAGATREIRRFPYEVDTAEILAAAAGTDRLFLRWGVYEDEGTAYTLFDGLAFEGAPLGTPTALRGDVDLNPYTSPVPVPLSGGFAAIVGFRIVIFDLDGVLVAWSGVLPAMPDRGGPDVLLSTGDGLLAMWLHLPESAEAFDLWAAAFDDEGLLVVPPHVVFEGLVRSPCYTRIAAASSPTGAVVAYMEGDGEVCDSPEIRVLNTDRWGNVRSAPLAVPSSDSPGRGDSFRVVADDEGWSVWMLVTEGPGLALPQLEFHRVVLGPGS